MKYFCENAPEYHIATAGSLLGVKVGQSAPFPVGKVNFLDMHPMSFGEFLDAVGKKQLQLNKILFILLSCQILFQKAKLLQKK